MKSRPWLTYAMMTTACWGIWGALIEIPEKAGFPATLGYCVWAMTMTIPAFFALKNNQWKLETDRKALFYGLMIGFLGSIGQLVLFHVLMTGPAYLVFPI